MHSIKRLLIVLGTIIVLAAAIPAVSAATPVGEIHVTKTCTFDSGLVCTIEASNVPGVIPIGTHGFYNGPLFTNRLSSEVVLVTPNGDTSTGHCTLSFADPVTNYGRCTFAMGTGSLAGFHANMKITDHLDTGVTDWDGSYHFALAD